MAHGAENDPFRPVVALPIAAVIHAASSLEAFMNEWIEKKTTIEMKCSAK